MPNKKIPNFFEYVKALDSIFINPHKCFTSTERVVNFMSLVCRALADWGIKKYYHIEKVKTQKFVMKWKIILCVIIVMKESQWKFQSLVDDWR